MSVTPRLALVATLLVACSLIPRSSPAQSVCPNTPPECRAHERYLVFDHGVQTWLRDDLWNGKLFDDGILSFDLLSSPTVFHRRSEKLCVVIADTNPLLYRARFGKVEVADNGDLSQLKDFLAAFGQSITGALESALDNSAQTWIDELKKRTLTLTMAVQELERQQNAAIRIVQEVEQGIDAQTLPQGFGELSSFASSACTTIGPPDRDCPRPASSTGNAREILSRLFECVDEARCRVQKILPTATDPLKAASGVLGRQNSAHKVLVNLRDFKKRFDDNSTGGKVNDCIVLGPWPHRSRWNKTFTQTVNVDVSSPYKGDVVARRPEKVETKFKVSGRVAPLLGFGVALTHSDLSSPEFGVEEMTIDDKKQNVIIQTGEDQRSAELALFMNYRFFQQITPKARRWPVQPSLEIGASVESDPGFFAGIGLEFGRYVRLGYGYTWQEVDDLIGNLGDPVDNKDAIKTRDRFEKDTYISLTVVLDSFSLFNKD